jgi:pimeloyl-ACP methyl ester carboxylesterase
MIHTMLKTLSPDHPTATGAFSEGERTARDVSHFGISLWWELRAMAEAAPGYVGEIVRNGVYPDRMTYRKLPWHPERSDLGRLRELNPTWAFRPDFDPRRWVFVFLHGYIDNTGGDRVAYKLASLGYQVYLVRYPFLRNVRRLAGELGDLLKQIAKREPGKRIVPVGHSLGGFIWDHLILHDPDVVRRYDMPLYIPMGSPHFGTLAAYLGVGHSAKQMRPHSDVVLAHLNRDFPPELEIYPFVSRFDLLVLPIETALLRTGINYVFSETGHVAQVIRNETVHAIEEIIASPAELLASRAEERPFYLSSLARGLRKLPPAVARRIGIEGVLAYVEGQADRAPEFKVRIVHRDLRAGRLPVLRHA